VPWELRRFRFLPTIYWQLALRGDGNDLVELSAAGASGSLPVFDSHHYSFAGGSYGANPVAGVVIGPSDVLYGTTQKGGSSNDGTVFSLTPAT